MRLKAAVIKRSADRLRLYHLRSTYFVDLDERALSAIEGALSLREGTPDVGKQLVDRLAARGLVEEGEFQPIERRGGTDMITLELEPIGRCNLACRHCLVSLSDAVMTPAIFDAAIEGAVALGAVEACFNGGEPLLHPSCLDWIDRACRAGLRVLLFTNGTTVTDEVAGRLAASGTARVNVSLDGLEPQHDALRGAGTFQRTVSGIRRLVAAGNRVFVTTVVHPANEPTLPEFRRFCKESLGIIGMRLSTVFPLGRAAGDPSLVLPSSSLRPDYEVLPEARPAVEPPPGILPCLAGVDKMAVAADGRVLGCSMFDGLPTVLGNLPGSSLSEIHASAREERTCEPLFGFSLDRLAGCRDCPALARCRGGCRARAWHLTGDPLGLDPVACRNFRPGA